MIPPYHVYNAKLEGNKIIISIGFFALLSMLFDYYEYKNNLKPNYLKVFDMLSGSVTPISIGFTEEADILKMIKKFCFLLKSCESITKHSIPIASILTCCYAFSRYNNFWQYIYLYITHTIHWTAVGYFIYAFIIWQIFYFYTFCYYIRIKLRSNASMVFWKLISNYGKSEINIKIILKNFDSIFAQINESNTNRWSNFIFAVWLTFGLT